MRGKDALPQLRRACSRLLQGSPGFQSEKDNWSKLLDRDEAAQYLF